MRGLARIGFTMAGLALLGPSAAWAGLPVVAGAPWSPAQQQASRPALARKPPKKAPERLCAECQRSKVMAAEGVNVPHPPPLPPGTIVKSGMCTVCGRPASIVAGRLPSRSLPTSARAAMMADTAPPGRAVVGGERSVASNGTDPMPIGVVQPRLAAGGAASASSPFGPAFDPMAAGGPTAPGGPRDAAVMPTSMASEPIVPKGGKRPHIISHMLGFDQIGRERADRNERRNEEKHAMISYGPANPTMVNDVPASAVYGR